MNRREKILAGAVLALVAVWFGNSWYGKYRDALADSRTAVMDARARLSDANLALAEGRRSVQLVETWQERSLPDDRERALSLYKAWLLAKAKEAGLAVEDINPLARTTNSAAFKSIGYQIDAAGSLSAVAALLYEFYRSPLLHQITRLRLTRPAGAAEMQLDLEVEALSLQGAAATDGLPEGQSQRLAFASLEEYQKSLSDRDLASIYTPPRPPGEATAQSEKPSPPKSDDAEHAHFSGTIGSGSKLQAWINVRTTGETLRLSAGDPVKVGTLEGEIVSVEPRTLVLRAGEKTLRIALGQTLRGGKELKPDAATSDATTADRPES